MAIIDLLIYDISEAIQYTSTFLNFIMLAQYSLHDNKTLCYIEHTLYRLKTTKIVFGHHWPMYSKLCWPTFNYPKFHVISHFIQYIWDYSSTVNYNTAHNKAIYKYLLKAFYNKTNKKEYNLQIWEQNICHTNIIAIKNMIISKKAKEMLWKNIMDTTAPAEVAQISNAIDFVERYNWIINNTNLDIVKKLGLTDIKKYWRCASQLEIKLDELYD